MRIGKTCAPEFARMWGRGLKRYESMSNETREERMARRQRIRAERQAHDIGQNARARQATKTERLMDVIRSAAQNQELARYGL